MTITILGAAFAPAVADLEPQIRQRTVTLGVVGLGYTGLPLALSYARAGVRVMGYDIDAAKVDMLRAGFSYLAEIPTAEVSGALSMFTPSQNPASLAQCDVYLVCVPTPLTVRGSADLRFVDSALTTIEPLLQPGNLVLIQSTVPPGTTASWAQRLSATTGLALGIDLFVATAPERIDPGNKRGWTVENTPRLVGGVTPDCARHAAAMLEIVCDAVIEVSGTEVAEAAKVFENTFRLVNIALTYELGAVCDEIGISAHEVIAAAATKPFGFLPHWPGPGVGGECIPVDPLFLVALAERSGFDLPLVRNAYLHVTRRPKDVVERLAGVIESHGGDLAGAVVLVAGVSYKCDIGDTRNAPSREIVRELRKRGAAVAYADPYVAEFEVDGEQVPHVPWNDQSVARHDYVVLVTPHSDFLRSSAWSAARLVIDTSHTLPAAERVSVL